MSAALERLQADWLRGLELFTREDLQGIGTLCQWLATCSMEDLRWLEEDRAAGNPSAGAAQCRTGGDCRA